MNIAIYLRKSRAEELSDTMEDTLKKHKETLIEFAKNNKLAISEVYEEVISGENLYARTQMLKLLEDVDTGLYDAVLCMDIDRLGRGAMSQQGIILETFKNSDTKIITPRKIFDLNNEMDEEYTEFQSFFARKEYKTINRRLQQGLMKTIEDGGYIANAPYGYEKCKVGKLPSLRIVEDEAKFVRMIFDMYVNQNYGGETIATTINAMGAKPRRGSAFNRTTILKIISNNVYIGKVIWNQKKHVKTNTINGAKKYIIHNPETEWMIVDGVHPPIIEENIYRQAQVIKKEKYHPSCKTEKLSNTLAGMIRCANCGAKMQFRNRKNNKGNDYLLCQAKGCIKATPFHLVEESLLDGIRKDLEELLLNANDTIIDTSHLLEAVNETQKEIMLVKKQQNSLYDLLEQQVYTIDIFTERNKVLENKLKTLDTTIKKLTAQIEIAEKRNVNNKIKKMKHLLDVYQISDPNERNRLLRSVIDYVIYYKESNWKTEQFTLTIHYKDL